LLSYLGLKTYFSFYKGHSIDPNNTTQYASISRTKTQLLLSYFTQSTSITQMPVIGWLVIFAKFKMENIASGYLSPSLYYDRLQGHQVDKPSHSLAIQLNIYGIRLARPPLLYVHSTNPLYHTPLDL
jgi:hypothetical protein